MRYMRKMMVAVLSFTMVFTSIAPIWATEGAVSGENQGAAEQTQTIHEKHYVQDADATASNEESQSSEVADSGNEAGDQTGAAGGECEVTDTDTGVDADPAGKAGNTEDADNDADKDAAADKPFILPDLSNVKLGDDKAAGKEPDYAPNQAVVLLKSEMSKRKAQAALSEVDSSIDVDKTIDIYNEAVTVAVVESDLSTDKLIKKLNQDDNVVIAEPNYIYHAMDVTDNANINDTNNTNDTYADKQWYYDAANIDIERDKGYTGDEKVVAVVDSGVDYKNEDLKDSMWTNTYFPAIKGTHGYDFVNVDGSPIDDNGHGTHCAGVIAASRNNGVGIKGVSNVKIMALKALDSSGIGYSESFIMAYNYIVKAQNLGVNIVAINNSWGGGEQSQILTALMNKAGEGGAISVCAAGNEANDNDKAPTYPASADCDYILAVAATDYDGKLASYSNYGKETVDIAAPGSAIWSTVSYDCYAPTLYDSDRQSDLSESYVNFENGESLDANMGYVNADGEESSEGFTVDDTAGLYGQGNAKKVTFHLKSGDLAYVRIPYYSGKDNYRHISTIFNISGPKNSSGYYALTDAASDVTVKDIFADFDRILNADNSQANYINTQSESLWRHSDYIELEKDDSQHYMYYLMYAQQEGDYTIRFDDFGISKDTDPSQFGKYDMLSGTSMAAPLVTGAYALKSDEFEGTAIDVKEAIFANVDDSNGYPVLTSGVLNFGKSSRKPIISGAKLHDDNIMITGAGLTGSTITINGETVEPVGTEGNYVIIPDNNYVNKLIDITVTNEDGTDTREKVYVVDGKKEFTACSSPYGYDEDEFNESGAYKSITSDGTYMYAVEGCQVVKANIKDFANGDDGAMWETISEITCAEFEGKDKDDKVVLLDKSVAYMNGRVYFVAGYGELCGMDVVIGTRNVGGWLFEETERREALYGGEYKLLSLNVNNGMTREEATLPKEVLQTTDRTIGAYNGKLYLIGGYDYSDASGKVTDQVHVYNPTTKKWTKGASIPTASAEGSAVQTGNRLVYIGGTSEKAEPEINVFNGTSWTSETIKTLTETPKISIDDNEFSYFGMAMAPTRVNGKNGVVISGAPTEYGDTFIYTVADGQFRDTGYQYSKKAEYSGLTGTAGGTKFLVHDTETGAQSAMPIGSALYKVKVTKTGRGNVTRTKNYVPGSKATVTAKAWNGYYVKAIYVNGKRVKNYTKKLRNRTYTVSSAITANKNVKVVFKKIPKKKVVKKTTNKTTKKK